MTWHYRSPMLVTISQEHVTDITLAVEAVMAQRASILLKLLSTVMSALQELDDSAQALGYKLLVTKPLDFFQCQASYLVDPGGFEIFVNISMAKHEDIVNLFRYRYIPVLVAEGTSLLVNP
jgi:hypothetical protein